VAKISCDRCQTFPVAGGKSFLSHLAKRIFPAVSFTEVVLVQKHKNRTK